MRDRAPDIQIPKRVQPVDYTHSMTVILRSDLPAADPLASLPANTSFDDDADTLIRDIHAAPAPKEYEQKPIHEQTPSPTPPTPPKPALSAVGEGAPPDRRAVRPTEVLVMRVPEHPLMLLAIFTLGSLVTAAAILIERALLLD